MKVKRLKSNTKLLIISKWSLPTGDFQSLQKILKCYLHLSKTQVLPKQSVFSLVMLSASYLPMMSTAPSCTVSLFLFLLVLSSSFFFKLLLISMPACIVMLQFFFLLRVSYKYAWISLLPLFAKHRKFALNAHNVFQKQWCMGDFGGRDERVNGGGFCSFRDLHISRDNFVSSEGLYKHWLTFTLLENWPGIGTAKLRAPWENNR